MAGRDEPRAPRHDGPVLRQEDAEIAFNACELAANAGGAVTAATARDSSALALCAAGAEWPAALAADSTDLATDLDTGFCAGLGTGFGATE